MRFSPAISLALVFIAASPARAEIRLVAPTPRTTMDSLTMFPCGGIPRSATSTRFTAGQSFTVTWEETTDADGPYTLAFSTHDDFSFEHILMEDIPDRTGGGTYMQEVRLPAGVTCDGCLLQLEQHTFFGTPPMSFFSCADLVVGTETDSGVAPPPRDGGPGAGTSDDGGCGCVTAGRPRGSDTGPLACIALVLLVVLSGLGRRRRVG